MTVAPETAADLLFRHYGLKGRVTPLPGEVDFNFHIRGEDGREYTLKISREGADPAHIDFQIALQEHLHRKGFPPQFPRTLPSRAGERRVRLEGERAPRWMRLQSWVPGRLLAEVNPRTDGLLQSWGRACGQLCLALQDFQHPHAPTSYHWNPSQTLEMRDEGAHFSSVRRRAIADHFWGLFEREALPLLPRLRRSVNYNDAHEQNLLVSADTFQPEVVGLIDFGDAMHTQTINELAIACAYAGQGMPDPLSAAVEVVRGFQAVFPLKEEEVRVLFPLIGARLMLTVATAARNRRREPDNPYLQVSDRPAWESLERLFEVHPRLAEGCFRQACGWEPCPLREPFEAWAAESEEAWAAPIPLKGARVAPLDLSVGSRELGNNAAFETPEAFQRTIRRLLEDKGAEVGVGGYGEVRPFYVTEAYQRQGNHGPQWRTVHLGLDIWAEAGTPVLAPLEGVVHSFADNPGDCNYGPTILLEHSSGRGRSFLTLYGHLSPESLEGLQVGQRIGKGQPFARIGQPPRNGNWPPHLHFQILLDALGQRGDFPGVAYPHQAAVWKSFCPDPTRFFEAFRFEPAEPMSMEEILGRRRRLLGRSLSISYAEPLHILRGYMQHLYDAGGRRYLDTVNNVPHVGHEHPRVVEALQRQAALLNTNTRYLHEEIIRFAEELCATLPPELSVVHFVNSGSEANELALRMVEACTGSREMLALEMGYHGNTTGCVAVSSYKFDRAGGRGAPPTTHLLPMPDPFRGRYRGEDSAPAYVAHAQELLERLHAEGRRLGGFIGESILSCAGQIVPPAGFYPEVYRLVRQAGGLCIADEVQVGLGRVGETFWGFELHGVLPDVVTIGKPLGNGHPLAAVVCTPAVAEAFANGMEYFNTFGGNPVSCAVGRAVLAVLREEDLQARARQVGAYLKSALEELQSRFPIIGQVRGHGLFLGIELVTDPATRRPATRQAHYLINRMRRLGILMSTDGPDENVLKIKPPLCFSSTDADTLLTTLERVLQEDPLNISSAGG
ncbi:MAG: aminotransferase class III-fold pyridoxal phosphate-dependent enzyme [Bacteroidetes bacterium]|nr:MAG: aminotransferase class III-fold pyridoxal phosphate-dependent enzyme [Bacteroidota bacterium]